MITPPTNAEKISNFCWKLHNARIHTGDKVCLVKDPDKQGVVLHMGSNHTIAKIQWNNPTVFKAEFVSRINKI